MTETDKAYTAGVIDGEGSICIAHPKKRKKGIYRLMIEVGQKDVPIIRWLKETWSGSHMSPVYQKSYPKAVFRWQIGGQAAALFLREILPYLILKKREAEVGIEFQEFKNGLHRIPGRKGHPYPPEYRTQAQVYYELMRALKDRSEDAPPPPPLTDPQLSFLLLLEEFAS